MPSLEERLAAIEARNSKVASDKAWETSLTRRSILAGITYVVAGFLLQLLDSKAPWLFALIPVVGYILSTLTLPFFRRLWQYHAYKENK